MGKRVGVWLAAVAVFSMNAAFGIEIAGIDQDGFLHDGTLSVTEKSGAFQVFKQGEFTITTPANTFVLTGMQGGMDNLSLGSGTTLTFRADKATALKVNDFTMTGGTLEAYGGTGKNLTTNAPSSFGLFVDGDFHQTGGDVFAVSGAGELNCGALYVFGKYVQDGGTLTAIGGSGPHSSAFAMWGGFTQNSGVVDLRAGTGEWSHAMGNSNHATFHDRLILRRGDAGSDGRVFDTGNNDQSFLTFGARSQLTYDLAGGGDLPFIRAKNVQIENGATVNFINTASIGSGTTQYDFIVSNYGIVGEFLLPNSATLEMSIAKTSGDDNYTAYFRRTGTAGDLIASTPGTGSNANSLITSLSSFYGTASLASIPSLNAAFSAFDSLTDSAEIAAQAEKITAMFTPADAVSSASNLATGVNGMTSQSMLRNVFSPAAGGGFNSASVSASSTDSLASLACPSGIVRSVWLTPLAQWTRTKPLSNGFSKANENTYGAGLGFGIRQDYNFAAGVGFHYLRSNMNSRTTDIDSDVFGLNLFGRKYFANQATFHPFVEGGIGYSYVDSKQYRKMVDAHSKPDSHVINGNFALGIDFLLGNTTLTPKIGLDYNHIRTGSYRETGNAGLAVTTDNFDSLRGVVGLGIKNQINDCLYVTANAAYKHEFADRNAITSNRFTASPDILFVTAGEKRSRSSGDFGVGLGWQPRSDVLVGVNYDLTIAEKQQSHSLGLRFGLDF